MRAWLIDDFSGIQKLRLANADDPVAGDGEAVLEIQYAALNPADRYLAEGHYPAKPPLPHVLGRDGIGKVIAVGPGVSDLKIGDERIVLRSEIGVSRAGTFAQRVAVRAESLALPPVGWTSQQSAAAPLVYLTAWQALTQWGELPPSVVLVTGASGGVGVASVQLAVALRHTVVALSRHAGKREQLMSLGAAVAVDPTASNWGRTVRDALGGRRVDLAIDNIGGELLPQVIDVLADRGRVSVVGRLAGPVPQFNSASLIFRRIRLGGVAVGAYTPAESQRAWRNLLQVLGPGKITPLVDRVFAFEELPQAFARLAEGPMGKVLIDVAGQRPLPHRGNQG